MDTSLRLLGITTNANNSDFSQNEEGDTYFDIEPALSPGKSEYTFANAYCYAKNAGLQLCIMPQNQYASVSVQLKDRTKIQNAEGKLNDNGYFTSIENRYAVWTDNFGKQETTHCRIIEFILDNDIKEDTLNFVVTVTAEDGETTQDYNLTLKIDRVNPEASSIRLNENSSSGKTLKFNSSEEGTIKYILKRER